MRVADCRSRHATRNIIKDSADPALKPFRLRKRKPPYELLKPHHPLLSGWFAWVFGTLLVLFVLGNVYAQLRMAQVTWELVTLARELGYTSDTHLHHEMKMRDTDPLDLRIALPSFTTLPP